MSLRKTALRGSMILTLGEVVSYGASFVRNMILARLLTKADFGIAATFAMIMMFLEFSAKLGVGRFVVQDKEGNEPEFLGTVHTFQFFASLLSSVVIAVAAWPMAILFGLKEQVVSFLVLAVLPIIHGLHHLDTRRFERELRFGPSALVGIIPQLLITLLAWPVAAWLSDYRAVLVLMILKALLSWIGSNWLAEQPYRWQFHKVYAQRLWFFGWPLLVNGLFTFIMMRGDQFIVASFYLMGEFGAYAAASSLTMAPTFFFRRVFASMILPTMAKVQDEPGVFNRRYGLVIAIVCAFSAAYAVAIIIGAEAFMVLVFGKKYVGSGYILAWLTAVNAIRNIRLAPTISAIAKGDSKNEMYSNFAGSIGLVIAFAVALSGLPIWMVAGSGLAGEFAACWVSFLRLTRRDGIPLKRSLIPASLILFSVVLAGSVNLFLLKHPLGLALELGLAAVGGGIFCGLVIALLEDSRQQAKVFCEDLFSGGWRAVPSLLGLPWSGKRKHSS